METSTQQPSTHTPPEQETTVLFVDDESSLANAYARSLNNNYNTITATGGEEALEMVDDTVDVIFLDRRMPNITGDVLLTKLRNKGFKQPIIMLSAVDPTEDIIDMPFDDYLQKPVGRQDIIETIETVKNQAELDKGSRKLYRLVRKKASLEKEGIRKDNGEYQQLMEEIETLRSNMDKKIEDIVIQNEERLFKDI